MGTYPYPSLMDMDAIEVAAKRKDAYWRVTRISRRSVKVTMWKVDGSCLSSDSSSPTTAPQWRRLCDAVWRRVQCTSLRLRNCGPVNVQSRVDSVGRCCNLDIDYEDDDIDSIPNWPGQACKDIAPISWHPFSKRRWPQGW